MAKYVIKFFPEYFSTSLWAVSENAYSDLGYSIRYETVGLPTDLIERLNKFDDSILGLIDWSDPGGDCPLTYEEQNKIYEEGIQLLQLVRDELGTDYEVIDMLDWIKPEINNE